jgi:hypothetical protein
MTDGEALGDEIAGLAGRLNAANQRLLSCVRRFDQMEEWYRQGALSCAHWLTWRIGLAPVAAREKVRVARALGELPRIDAAFAGGRLSYSQVRAVTRIATAANEGTILEVALVATGAQLERICRGYRTATEGEKEAAKDRQVKARALGNGLVKLEIVLAADEADLVVKAIERARVQLTPGRFVSEPQTGAKPRAVRKPPVVAAPRPTAADALVHVAQLALEMGPLEAKCVGIGPGVSTRGEVVIHVDRDLTSAGAELRASLEDGTQVSAEALRRVCCDGGLVTAAIDEQGAVLDVGRKTRAIPTAIRRALWVRDGGCRFPGCSNSRFLHGHHITHWLHGGRTSLDNLVLLCSFHHRQVHEGGFSLRLTEAGRVEVRTPAGAILAWNPALAADPGLIDWNSDWWGGGGEAEIDAWSATPTWGGERPEYNWIVDAMVNAAPSLAGGYPGAAGRRSDGGDATDLRVNGSAVNTAPSIARTMTRTKTIWEASTRASVARSQGTASSARLSIASSARQCGFLCIDGTTDEPGFLSCRRWDRGRNRS